MGSTDLQAYMHPADSSQLEVGRRGYRRCKASSKSLKSTNSRNFLTIGFHSDFLLIRSIKHLYAIGENFVFWPYINLHSLGLIIGGKLGPN